MFEATPIRQENYQQVFADRLNLGAKILQARREPSFCFYSTNNGVYASPVEAGTDTRASHPKTPGITRKNVMIHGHTEGAFFKSTYSPSNGDRSSFLFSEVLGMPIDIYGIMRLNDDEGGISLLLIRNNPMRTRLLQRIWDHIRLQPFAPQHRIKKHLRKYESEYRTYWDNLGYQTESFEQTKRELTRGIFSTDNQQRISSMVEPALFSGAV